MSAAQNELGPFTPLRAPALKHIASAPHGSVQIHIRLPASSFLLRKAKDPGGSGTPAS
jgi:hypothetical protein